MIASVFEASVDDYEHIVSKATSSFEEWRKVPAPIRGDLVREMGNALRKNKDINLIFTKPNADTDGRIIRLAFT